MNSSYVKYSFHVVYNPTLGNIILSKTNWEKKKGVISFGNLSLYVLLGKKAKENVSCVWQWRMEHNKPGWSRCSGAQDVTCLKTLTFFPDWWCLGTKSCPTLCDPMDCSPPGSSVHGIFQARILEWVAISSSIPS